MKRNSPAAVPTNVHVVFQVVMGDFWTFA